MSFPSEVKKKSKWGDKDRASKDHFAADLPREQAEFVMTLTRELRVSVDELFRAFKRWLSGANAALGNRSRTIS
jgi:hypothetical protein